MLVDYIQVFEHLHCLRYDVSIELKELWREQFREVFVERCALLQTGSEVLTERGCVWNSVVVCDVLVVFGGVVYDLNIVVALRQELEHAVKSSSVILFIKELVFEHSSRSAHKQSSS